MRRTLLLALIAAGCGGERAQRPTAEIVREAPEIVVTRDAPAPCRPRAAANAILRFLEAAGAGRAKAAADAFDFGVQGWYSVGSGDGAPAGASTTVTDREALRRYLAARHRQGERYRLRVLRISARGGIEFYLRRRAGDLSGGLWVAVEGKGAIDCDTGSLTVWSMGSVAEHERVGPLCPRASRPGSASRVTACARNVGH